MRDISRTEDPADRSVIQIPQPKVKTGCRGKESEEVLEVTRNRGKIDPEVPLVCPGKEANGFDFWVEIPEMSDVVGRLRNRVE